MTRRSRRAVLQGSLGCLAAAVSGPARSADPVTLRINAFPNAKALPLQAGIATGIFERRGFKIDLELTEGSRPQREGLASGKTHVAHSAVDNALEVVKKLARVVTTGARGAGVTEIINRLLDDDLASLPPAPVLVPPAADVQLSDAPS